MPERPAPSAESSMYASMTCKAVRLLRSHPRHETQDSRFCLVSHVSLRLPAYLYLLSTLMFAIVNLARGYIVAGMVGVIVLLVVARAAWPVGARQMFFPGREAS